MTSFSLLMTELQFCLLPPAGIHPSINTHNYDLGGCSVVMGAEYSEAAAWGQHEPFSRQYAVSFLGCVRDAPRAMDPRRRTADSADMDSRGIARATCFCRANAARADWAGAG